MAHSAPLIENCFVCTCCSYCCPGRYSRTLQRTWNNTGAMKEGNRASLIHACFVLLFLFVEVWLVFREYAIVYCVVIEYCSASGLVFIWLLLHLYIPWTTIIILVDSIWTSHLSPCKRTAMWHIRGQRTTYSVPICCQMVHPMYSLLHVLAVTYAWRYYLVKGQGLYHNSTIHILPLMLFYVFHHHVDGDGYSLSANNL